MGKHKRKKQEVYLSRPNGEYMIVHSSKKYQAGDKLKDGTVVVEVRK